MTSTTFIDKTTLIEAPWLNDVDALVYQGQLDDGTTGASISRYLPSGTGAVATTVQSKLRESVSVKDFGAVGDGVTDDSAAFSAMWAYIKSTYENPVANLVNVSVSAVVPPGQYLINTSINWTGLVTWNIHIEMRGAVLTAGSGCSGKAMIDATGVRGLHLEGGYIESTLAAASAPLCGILIGPAGTATCGNNNFRDVQIEGVFTLAPFVNIGSETTCYYNCYFAQTNTNTSAYAYVGDGLNHRAAVVSLYTTLRANDVAVSFTSNTFYSCHFRNYGGGSAAWVAQTSNWTVDKGCYILAFDRSSFEFYQTVTWRNYDFALSGLFETTQGAGLKNLITFILAGTDSSAIVNLRIDMAGGHYSDAMFNVTNEAGGTPTGTMALNQLDVRTFGGVVSGSKLFNVANGKKFSVDGVIRYRTSSQLNLYDCKRFVGQIETGDGSLISGTVGGGDVFSYSLIDPATFGGQVLAIAKGPDAYLGVQTFSYPILRGEGTATDIDLALQGKGAGNVRFGTRTASADAPITGYIEIKDLSGTVRKLAVIG